MGNYFPPDRVIKALFSLQMNRGSEANPKPLKWNNNLYFSRILPKYFFRLIELDAELFTIKLVGILNTFCTQFVLHSYSSSRQFITQTVLNFWIIAVDLSNEI